MHLRLKQQKNNENKKITTMKCKSISTRVNREENNFYEIEKWKCMQICSHTLLQIPSARKLFVCLSVCAFLLFKYS
jgi:hypothetical protein